MSKLFEEITCQKFEEFVLEKKKSFIVNEQEDGSSVSIRDSGDLEKYLESFLKKNKLEDKFTVSVENYGTGEVILGDKKNISTNYGTLKIKKEGRGVDKIWLTVSCNIKENDSKYETFNNPIKLVDVLKTLTSEKMKINTKLNTLTQLLHEQNPEENKIIIKSL